MKIPIEIIIFGLGVFVSIVTAVIWLFWTAITALRTGFEEVKDILIEVKTASKFEEKECQTRHTCVDKKLNNHEERIGKLEKK